MKTDSLEILNDDCLRICFSQLEGLADAYNLALSCKAFLDIYQSNSYQIEKTIIICSNLYKYDVSLHYFIEANQTYSQFENPTQAVSVFEGCCNPTFKNLTEVQVTSIVTRWKQFRPPRPSMVSKLLRRLRVKRELDERHEANLKLFCDELQHSSSSAEARLLYKTHATYWRALEALQLHTAMSSDTREQAPATRRLVEIWREDQVALFQSRDLVKDLLDLLLLQFSAEPSNAPSIN